MAALGELERGKMTRTEVITAFALSVGEQTELDTLTAKMIGTPEAYPMGAFVTLTNVGAAYDAITASKGLGFVAMDITGITRLTWRVRYNKIGTGTLSWQLWNETDSQELGVFDDAAAAGDNKQQDIVVTPAQPLTGGVKLLRGRVKSTVATDDPLFYGSCMFVRRVQRLTSADLHELLLLAELRLAPYNTVAALKTRLGV